MLNWYFGWAAILTAFATGAVLGLFFHREDFLGGYASFRRRILRLVHIALAALGAAICLACCWAPHADQAPAGAAPPLVAAPEVGAVPDDPQADPLPVQGVVRLGPARGRAVDRRGR